MSYLIVNSQTDLSKVAPELQNLAQANNGNRNFFQACNLPPVRDSMAITVDKLCTAVGLGYDTVRQICRHLESLQIGKFIVGRRGSETRFEWNFAPGSVAEAALNLHKMSNSSPLTSKITLEQTTYFCNEARFRLAEQLGIDVSRIEIRISH